MNHSVAVMDPETTGTDPGSPLTRRKLLQRLALGTALTLVPLRTAGGAGEERDTAVFGDTLETLKVWLAKCFAQSRVDYGNGLQSAIAHQDAGFARQLAEDMRTHMEQSGFAEWITAEGNGAGAKGFLMGITLPALGLMSILERKPLLEYF